MNEKTVIYQCNNIGVSGTTPVHVKQNDDGIFEARCGFALMGMTNMNEKQFAACDYNPFHEEFNDNYALGYGIDESCALEALKAAMKGTSDSLWI